MKIVVCTKYGPPEVLQITEAEKPEPAEGEVRIKLHCTTVHIGDTKLRSLQPGLGPVRDFFFKPLMRIAVGFSGPRNKILGMEFSGTIDAVGKNVHSFKVGDAVFAATGNSFGAYAEYRCLPETGLIAIKPANITFEEAASLSNGGLTALLHLRKAKIQKGQRVLVYGASGSVGTFAIQLAKHFETTVTGVCSTANLELVRLLGANEVFDYTKEDLYQLNNKFDIIFDAVGKMKPALRKKLLAKSGAYRNVLDLTANLKFTIEDLNFLTLLCERGELQSVIDKRYPFSEIVEAHRYVDMGHKKGNVVINF